MRWLRVLTALWLAATTSAASDHEPEGDVRSISLRTHSLKMPYLDSDMSSRWFEFGGDTIIRTDAYIRLTSDRPSQSGWIFSRIPLTATNWEIEVEFSVDGRNQLFGDGFAMWVTKDRAQTGPVFGHADNFEGLGIFFDTYKNNRPGVVFPYVMAMFGDGKTHYNKDNDGKDTELAGCSARGIRQSSVPTKFKLTYFQDKQLKLELQYKVEGQWELCFETDSPPQIPAVTYLGFSAETGELSDNHDIISVDAKNLYTVGSQTGKPTAGKKKGGPTIHSKHREGSGGWSWLLLKILLFGLVLGGAYVGYTAYRASTKKHRF